MFVYKKLKASDVSITPSEAHKQYSYDSSSAGANGLTFNTALWTSESKAHYSTNTLAGNFQNHRKYFQLDKIFYRDYITDNANLIPDVNYIKQERRLYDKTNILSIPQNLFGSRIHPSSFNLTGSFNSGNTNIEIKDDGEGNIYPTTYTLGTTNWPSEKGRIVYIAPVKGFKKKDLTVIPGTGHKIVNEVTSFTLENVYDDSYYINQVDYNKVTFNGDTPLTFINTGTEGHLRLDHDSKYNFGFDEDFNISFYFKTSEIDSQRASGSADNGKYYFIAKSDTKTIIPNPGEGQSEILSTFVSGNLQALDVPAENTYPFKIYYTDDIDETGSIFFERSNGSLTSFVSTSLFYSGSTDEIIHISAQKTGNELQIWKNGIKTVSGSDINPVVCKDQPPTNEANLYIGSRGNIDSYLNSNLSQIMIWDGALSATQIQNISESITGTPYIGNIFYDEGFVTINHPSYSDVLQQYGSSQSQTITLNPTYGDQYNYDAVINVTDPEAWKSQVTAFNQENKVFSSNYSELLLGPNTNKITIPGGSATGSLLLTTNFDYILTANENVSVWNGSINIQKLSSSFITYSLDSDTAADNPFTPSGSQVGFVDKGSYLFLSASTTTNTTNVTLQINSSSLFFEDFIEGGGPGAGPHDNIDDTKFSYATDNDGGVAIEPFPYVDYMVLKGSNTQVHQYDGIGPFKTSTQEVAALEEQITFDSSFSYTPYPSQGTPQNISSTGLLGEYSNNRLKVNHNVAQSTHNGATITIQAFATVAATSGRNCDVTLILKKNGSEVASSTFTTGESITTGTVVYTGYTPIASDLFTLHATSENQSVGPNEVDFLGGTNSNPKTFIRGASQSPLPGFKNYLALESDTWTTTANGYYKHIIEGIRTDGTGNWSPTPPDDLGMYANPDESSGDLGVCIQLLKNGVAITSTIVPKDTNFGTYEHDFIETGTGGDYKFRIFICENDYSDDPPLGYFASNQGFRFGKTTVYGRDKTNTFTIEPGLALEYKTISPGNVNNSSFNFDDVAGLVPDSTIIQTITSAGGSSSTITLESEYTITSSIGATASYDDQVYVSASAQLSISESAVYVLKDFELGVDETSGLGTLMPRLRVNTNINGTITQYGPYVGSQNVPDINFGVLTGSDSINMDLDIIQNFGTPGTPIYNPTATGDGVGFSIDNLNIDAIFPTSSITRLSGDSFPSTTDSITFFSAHTFDEGDARLPFTTGSITKNVTYIDANTLKLSEELFITASTTAEGFDTLTSAPLTASLLIPAKTKTIYNDLKFEIGGLLSLGSNANIAVKLLDPDGSTITSSLYPPFSTASLTFTTPQFTASAAGNFKLDIYSSDASFNPIDVTGSTTSTSDYIGLKGMVSSSVTSGSYTITKTSGDDFTSNTVAVEFTSSHTDGGPFPGGSGFASYTTGSSSLAVSAFISETQIQTNTLLFVTESSNATGSVNLGNQYFLYTASVLNVGTNLPIPLLEGNFTNGSTEYNILSVNGENITLDQNILITTPTSFTLNYHTTTSNEYTVQFKNSHLIFENEYQCSVDEEEYNYTQNISVRKNKSTQSPDLANCITGSIDNSQITLFKPYVTTVGLYDDEYNLVALGKFAQPIKMSEETDMTFIIRYDT